MSSEQFLVNHILEPSNLTLFLAICSGVTYAITSIVRPWLRVMIETKELRVALTQLISCCFGAVVGFQLSTYSSLGLWLGFGSGALNVLIVSYIKQRLGVQKNLQLPFEETPPPNTKSKEEDS